MLCQGGEHYEALAPQYFWEIDKVVKDFRER